MIEQLSNYLMKIPTFVLAIMFVPLFVYMMRKYVYLPIEKYLQNHFPGRVTDFLTKERGDDRKPVNNRDENSNLLIVVTQRLFLFWLID